MALKNDDLFLVGRDGDSYKIKYEEIGGQMPTGGGDPKEKVFYENSKVVDEDYTITSGNNAMSAGPLTVNATVTVPDGSTWTVVGDGEGGGSGGGGTVVNYNGASAWANTNSTATLRAGYNLKVVQGSTNTRYDYTFITPMSSADYAVVATGNSSNTAKLNCNVYDKTATGFSVQTNDTITGDGNPGAHSVIVQASNAIAPPSGVGADGWAFTSADAVLQSGYNLTVEQGSSITRYNYTFVTPMPNANYGVLVTGNPTSDSTRTLGYAYDKTATGFTVQTLDANNDGTGLATRHAVAVFASSTVTPTFTWKRDGTTVELANAGDGLSAGNGNMTVNGDGAILVNRDTGTKDVIAGQLNGATTSHIYADGSATFASFVEAKGGVYGSRDSSSQLAYVGRVTGGATTFQVTAGGVITAANVAFNLDPDNSANYVSTTSAEGETESVYNGPTLDVKEVLLNLQSKIHNLEARINEMGAN